jgi:hypothetical protein
MSKPLNKNQIWGWDDDELKPRIPESYTEADEEDSSIHPPPMIDLVMNRTFPECDSYEDLFIFEE